LPDLTFHIIFRHPKFAALKAEEVPSDEKLDGEKLWPYPTEPLIVYRFEDFHAPNCSREYTGEIVINPVKFELESFARNIDRELDMQKTPHGYIRLPRAVVEATIKIEDVPTKISQTLLWYSKLVEHIDYETIAKEELEKLPELVTAIFGGEEELLAFATKNKRDPNLIHVLARTDDEEYDGDFEDRLSRYKKILEPKEVEVLTAFGNMFAPLLASAGADELAHSLEILNNQLPMMIKAQANYTKSQDSDGKKLRWRYWKEISENITKIFAGTKKKPQNVDPESTELFGEDLFHLLRHYWNLVIRYLRYERLQYWLEEFPSYELGQFYINNSVTVNCNVVIPCVSIRMELMLITDEIEYLDQEKWIETIQTTQDMQLLEKYSGGFEIGGIFSQSLRSLIDREFENAVILALIGLDSAMSEIMQIIRPGFKGSTPGQRIPVVRKEFKVRGMLDFSEDDFDSSWNIMMNGKEKKGLLFLRNEVVHDDRKLPSSDSDLRADILQMIKTARLLAYRLSIWKRTQPKRKSR
jgi:hypothetical protein